MLAGLLIATFVTSVILTGWLRRYALHRSLLDVPNHRSSHRVPTPRGGGVAIVVSVSLAIGALALLDRGWAIPPPALGAAVFVAIIGFWDDHGGLPAGIRLAAHTAAASVVVWAIGGLTWPMGDAVAVFLLVWWLNLTNFMDGIDGIAAVQTICVCVGVAVIGYSVVGAMPEIAGALALAAGATGFLVWNWPPARIFMGDAGSGYVGFMTGIIGLALSHREPALFWVWLVLSAAFAADATVTLGLRILRRERLFEAHRSHAYQRLARVWGHRRVTLLLLAVNIVGLLPLAGAAVEIIPGWVAAVAAYGVLSAAVLWISRRWAVE